MVEVCCLFTAVTPPQSTLTLWSLLGVTASENDATSPVFWHAIKYKEKRERKKEKERRTGTTCPPGCVQNTHSGTLLDCILDLDKKGQGKRTRDKELPPFFFSYISQMLGLHFHCSYNIVAQQFGRWEKEIWRSCQQLVKRSHSHLLGLMNLSDKEQKEIRIIHESIDGEYRFTFLYCWQIIVLIFLSNYLCSRD